MSVSTHQSPVPMPLIAWTPPPMSPRERTAAIMRTAATAITPLPLARWAVSRSSARFVAGCSRTARHLPRAMRRRGYHRPGAPPMTNRRTFARATSCRTGASA